MLPDFVWLLCLLPCLLGVFWIVGGTCGCCLFCVGYGG